MSSDSGLLAGPEYVVLWRRGCHLSVDLQMRQAADKPTASITKLTAECRSPGINFVLAFLRAKEEI